jgi:hypothetical protein
MFVISCRWTALDCVEASFLAQGNDRAVNRRDKNRLQSFCLEISEDLGVPVEPASSADEATRFGEIVCTATTSQQPVVRGECLQPGAHVNAIGANMANRRELDDEAIRCATLIAVGSVERRCNKEKGEIWKLISAGSVKGYSGASIPLMARLGRLRTGHSSLFTRYCFSEPSPSIAIFLAVISPLSARSPATDIVSPVRRSCEVPGLPSFLLISVLSL